jgi:predicted nucleotidyltransferase
MPKGRGAARRGCTGRGGGTGTEVRYGRLVASLTDAERECVRRYCALVADTLGPNLRRVILFGSAARGDMWPEASPMHSDVDLLVETDREVAADERSDLVDATYELFLECGRQISPTFRTVEQLASSRDERVQEFAERLAADGVVVWPPRSVDER